MENPGKIKVESLVADKVCPFCCPACAEETRELQARRELIMLAQATQFDEMPLAVSNGVSVPRLHERRAA